MIGIRGAGRVCAVVAMSLLLANAQDFLADGTKALDANQPAAAEALFRQAIAADPKDYLAHFDLALALSMQRKDAEAIPELRRTLELKPGLYEADMNLAIILLRDRMPAEALPVLKEAMEAKPAEARPHALYDQALGQIDEIKQEEARLEAARLEEAKREAKRQAEAPFNNHMDRGRQLRDDHKYAEAAQEFMAASKIRPDSITVWRELAAAFVINKNFPEGLAALDRLKALGDETPGDLYFRAISLDSLHQHKPALEAYRRFLAVAGGKFPDDEFRARQRARIIEDEMKRR